jgi:pyrroline-5-carboxylate reductase
MNIYFLFFHCLREKLTAIGVSSTENNSEVVQFADVIIIATKPDVVKSCLENLQETLSPDDFQTKSFLSIAAGVPLSALESYLPLQTKSVIRVMPNTPCLVGQCAAAFASGTKTTNEDKAICTALFNSVGTISEIPEKLMDAVTGLSGSGPACKSIPLSLPCCSSPDPDLDPPDLACDRCVHVH